MAEQFFDVIFPEQIAEAEIKLRSFTPLAKAAAMGGEFPTSVQLLEVLRHKVATSDPSLGQVAELIQSDPVMTLRLISMANSTLYNRGRSLPGIKDALGLLGYLRIEKIAADLGTPAKFSSFFASRGVASSAWQWGLTSLLLTREMVRVMAPRQNLEDLAHSAATLNVLPFMLLATGKPEIFSWCCLCAMRDKSSSFDKSFKRLTGSSPSESSHELAKMLSLPETILEQASLNLVLPWHRRKTPIGKDRQTIALCSYMAQRLAKELYFCSSNQTFSLLLREFARKSHTREERLREGLGRLPMTLLSCLDTLGITSFRFPDYFWNLIRGEFAVGTTPAEDYAAKIPPAAERMRPFLKELSECLGQRLERFNPFRLPHAIHCTLRTLVHGLGFDRACLYSCDEISGQIHLEVCLGTHPAGENWPNKTFTPAEQENLVEFQALRQKRTVFTGDSLFPDHWPFVAFPLIRHNRVIKQSRAIGLFYADRMDRKDAAALDASEQASCARLAEEWNDIVL